MARLYAAESVSALEYLHDTVGIVSWLKPINVMLDGTGHITLCGAGLYARQLQIKGEIVYKMAEYPAPELLRGEKTGDKAADWWTLGVFLYEMLTGLPLFYDNNVERIGSNILGYTSR
jgi:serum/glucocorticoid-regulated kinase 2